MKNSDALFGYPIRPFCTSGRASGCRIASVVFSFRIHIACLPTLRDLLSRSSPATESHSHQLYLPRYGIACHRNVSARSHRMDGHLGDNERKEHARRIAAALLHRFRTVAGLFASYCQQTRAGTGRSLDPHRIGARGATGKGTARIEDDWFWRYTRSRAVNRADPNRMRLYAHQLSSSWKPTNDLDAATRDIVKEALPPSAHRILISHDKTCSKLLARASCARRALDPCAPGGYSKASDQRRANAPLR